MATFEGKCKSCGQLFELPSLGDFAYGENLLHTIDGKHHEWVNGFSEFPERVSGLLNENQKKMSWDILAALADKIEGKRLVTDLVCPHCSSQEIEYWEGSRIGMATTPEISFTRASQLDNSELQTQINAAATHDA